MISKYNKIHIKKLQTFKYQHESTQKCTSLFLMVFFRIFKEKKLFLFSGKNLAASRIFFTFECTDGILYRNIFGAGKRCGNLPIDKRILAHSRRKS